MDRREKTGFKFSIRSGSPLFWLLGGRAFTAKSFDEIKYEFARGSDVIRDGMFMEVSVANTNPLRQLAEIFYSDVTKDFVLTCYESNVPLGIIASLIKLAQEELPLIEEADNG